MNRNWTCVLVLAAACAGESSLATREREVQVAHAGDYYEVVTRPEGALGMAQMSEGAVFQDLGTFDFGTAAIYGYPAVTRPIRASCGLTFVSPTHAITAGHCVDEIAAATPITVQMYQLRVEAEADWPGSTTLTGVSGGSPHTYPLWSHDPIDGYHVVTYTCHVAMRCGAGNGLLACGIPGAAAADLAVLACDQPVGCAFDYAPVADHQAIDDPVALVWSHEVYDAPVALPPVADAVATELFKHYTLLHNDVWLPWSLSPTAFNLHYVGSAPGQPPDHQLLPLVQESMAGGGGPIATTIRSNAHLANVDGVPTNVVTTSLSGCHGTSGAGVFADDRKTRGVLALLGPVVTGPTFSWPVYQATGLCADSPGGDPGHAGEAYTALQDVTDAFKDVIAPAGVTCSTATQPAPPLLWTTYDHTLIPELVANAVTLGTLPGTWPCETCSAWERLRSIDEPTVVVPAGGSFTIPYVTFQARTRYRLTARVFDTTADGTPTEVSHRTLGGYFEIGGAGNYVDSPAPHIHAGEYVAMIVGTLDVATTTTGLTIRNDSPVPMAFTDLQIVVEGVANDFEDRVRRSSAVRESGGARSPMRFVGDPGGGWSALLAPGERMYLRREAFTPWPTWSAALRVDGDLDGLVCGLAYRNGSEQTKPCEPSGPSLVKVTFDPTCPGGGIDYIEPVAFFVERPAAAAGDLLVDDVVLTHETDWAPCQ